MTESFKIWLVGLAMVFIISVIVWWFGWLIAPMNHFTLFEVWSVILTIVTLSTGFQEYYNEDEIDD